MKEWLTVKDVSEYLQIPESRVRSLVNQRQIPFYDHHRFLRFNRLEIDNWMKTPPPQKAEESKNIIGEENMAYIYRGKSIKDYTLTATKILIGITPLVRLHDFIKQTVWGITTHNRDFLFREEFRPFHANFMDYLRASCQLGLIEKVRDKEQDSRIVRYYPTEYARRISLEADIERVKEFIGESILHIVHNHRETLPDERHAILLLWYLLKIKENGLNPQEHHFKLEKDKPNNDFPKIRLAFTSSLCKFLFNGIRENEREFLTNWERLI